MLEQTTLNEKSMNKMHSAGSPVYMPSGTLLLLSAIYKGWQISEIGLEPSWDQHGFVYLVTLRLPFQNSCQQIILPKNPMVEDLLTHTAGGFLNRPVHSFQVTHA